MLPGCCCPLALLQVSTPDGLCDRIHASRACKQTPGLNLLIMLAQGLLRSSCRRWLSQCRETSAVRPKRRSQKADRCCGGNERRGTLPGQTHTNFANCKRRRCVASPAISTASAGWPRRQQLPASCKNTILPVFITPPRALCEASQSCSSELQALHDDLAVQTSPARSQDLQRLGSQP